MLESYFYRARVATQNLPHIAKQLRRFWRGIYEMRLIFFVRANLKKKVLARICPLRSLLRAKWRMPGRYLQTELERI